MNQRDGTTGLALFRERRRAVPSSMRCSALQSGLLFVSKGKAFRPAGRHPLPMAAKDAKRHSEPRFRNLLLVFVDNRVFDFLMPRYAACFACRRCHVSDGSPGLMDKFTEQHTSMLLCAVDSAAKLSIEQAPLDKDSNPIAAPMQR